MTEIRLNNGVWSFDPEARLGEKGGFGEVFRGVGSDGQVAVKRLNVSSADAHREIDMARLLSTRRLEHVVPILDWGRDQGTDAYYIVMPVCDGSLDDLLEAEAPLGMTSAQVIALQIVDGLLEVEDIVHRDLKPGNVLRRGETWAVSDFGISKPIADSTSLDTMRDVLSAYYASPEQWRGERPTSASDVYALGCIIHAMVDGSPPFRGDKHALRAAHLQAAAPALSGNNPRLTNFVRLMLRKEPGNRPDLKRCREVLSTMGDRTAAHPGLAAAAGHIAAQKAQHDAAEAQVRSERQRRDALASEAGAELDGIFKRLCAAVTAASDDAVESDRMLRFGPATLTRSRVEQVEVDLRSIEVIAWCSLVLKQGGHDPTTNTQGEFGATLAFSRSSKAQPFRWTESGFHAWSGRSEHREAPFPLAPDSQEFTQVHSNVVSGYQLAYGPLPIDGEDEEDFRGRWLALIARAATGRLYRSSTMPLPPGWFERL